MLLYKVVFLTLAIFAVSSFASDDDDFVDLTSDEAEKFMGVFMAILLRSSWDENKTATLETITDMFRSKKTEVIIAASRNEYDTSGDIVKTSKISFYVPGSKNVSTSESEESSEEVDSEDEDDVIEKFQSISYQIHNLTDIRMIVYGVEYDKDGSVIEEGYISNELTVLKDNDHETYNFTAITTKEEMENILSQFDGELTKVYKDVDDNIVKSKSTFTYDNGFVTIASTSDDIPPNSVMMDAVEGFTRIALMYPDELPKRMAEYLKAKNANYQYILYTSSEDLSIIVDYWFKLQYNDFDDISDIVIAMNKLEKTN